MANLVLLLILALFKGEAFAHRYRMWQRVYREILMTGGRKDVDY
ncbi:hypothetical protein ACNGWS_25695 [Klebsiella pneumoniae]|nr:MULTISPECIES: hypothetical protein [Klebsiella]MCW9256098.1 hypothetical protein [Klebsiella pneumoniae]